MHFGQNASRGATKKFKPIFTSVQLVNLRRSPKIWREYGAIYSSFVILPQNDRKCHPEWNEGYKTRHSKKHKTKKTHLQYVFFIPIIFQSLMYYFISFLSSLNFEIIQIEYCSLGFLCPFPIRFFIQSCLQYCLLYYLMLLSDFVF